MKWFPPLVLLLVLVLAAVVPAFADVQIKTPGTACPGPDSTVFWEQASLCPQGTLLWQRPAYQFGPSTSQTCNSGLAGMVQWTSTAASPNNTLQYCNGTSWTNFAASGSGILLGSSATATNPQATGDAGTGLFSATASSVSIATAGVERLRVTAAGNVGIGTTTPTALLEITQDIGVASGMETIARFYRSSGNNRGVAFGYKGDGTTDTTGIIRSTGVSGDLAFATVDALGNTIEAMRVTATGSVGIGTTGPTAMLHLRGDGPNLLLENQTANSSNRPKLKFSEAGTNHMSISYDGTLFAPNNKIIIRDESSNADHVTFVQNGNVGIDTIAPLSKLDINGGVAIGSYAGTATAPSNGLIVSGGIGIATSSPRTSLDAGYNTDALVLQSGTTGQRPASPVGGMMRYNTTANTVEFYQNGEWVYPVWSSDVRLKTHIAPVKNALDIVTGMRPVFFDWDKDNPKASGMDDRRHIGFLAQELENVLPEVVNVGADTYRTVEYGPIVAVAVGAVKEVNAKVDSLAVRNNRLARDIDDLKALNDEIRELREKVETLSRSCGAGRGQ